MPADLPPHLHERIVCSIAAAAKYKLPANLVLAVAEQEGGQPGQWVRNANGTHDVGVMQFNTAYLESELARYGIQAAHVAAYGCYPYDLASWRLSKHVRHDKGDIWSRAANYHSKTPHHNRVYRAKLVHRAAKWGTWLLQNFETYDGSNGRSSPSKFTPNCRLLSVMQLLPQPPRTSVQTRGMTTASHLKMFLPPEAEENCGPIFADVLGVH